MIYLTLIPILVNMLLINAEGVVVNTTQGQLRGESLLTVTGTKYYSFKGIPYAKPPVGDLRFLPPQAPDLWTGVRNATTHGSVCPQPIPLSTKTIGNEDCLYLNVYTPSIKFKRNLPVMFFIHGGGFQRGSGNSDRYGPDYLMAQKVVLVTINYRLGLLGFLNLNITDVSGNAGMKDQVAALEWVKNNIVNFGGDPSNVLLFGQSSGGESVTLHALSPLSKGLFKRGVAMSGVFLNDWATPFQNRRRMFRLGQQLGFSTRDDHELLKFFKTLPPEMFLNKNPAILRSQDPQTVLNQLTYLPVVEQVSGPKSFLTSDPRQTLIDGKVNEVDLMVGRTSMEGLIFFVYFGSTSKDLYLNYAEMVVPTTVQEYVAPAKMLTLADNIHTKYFGNKPINDSVAQEFIKYISDSYFGYGIDKFVQRFSKFRDTFVYQFSKITNFTRQFSVENEFGIRGATHNDDLLYLFYPQDGSVTLNTDSEDYMVVNTTCSLYANFAKYGNPTPDGSLGVKWYPYSNETEYYLDINTNLTLERPFDRETIAFWDSIYKGLKL